MKTQMKTGKQNTTAQQKRTALGATKEATNQAKNRLWIQDVWFSFLNGKGTKLTKKKRVRIQDAGFVY